MKSVTFSLSILLRYAAGFLLPVCLIAYLSACQHNGRSIDESNYEEPWRPRYHFTPEANWMEGPEGFVHANGAYHIFFQYNPFNSRPAYQHWGHIKSRDLVHWEQEPVAIYPSDEERLRGGSVVVDIFNSSGLCTDAPHCLIAVMTAETDEKSQQQFAYSFDQGLSWNKTNSTLTGSYLNDFQHPTLFWFEPTNEWIMTLAEPQYRKVHFFSSPDLINWLYLDSFGPAGVTHGYWEKAILLPIPIPGVGARKWVLVVSGSGRSQFYSGVQYFIGDFDGKNFHASQEGDWLDYGPDFDWATACAFPPDHTEKQPLIIGGMYNRAYYKQLPTTPWKGTLSLPRKLQLARRKNRWKLVQTPVLSPEVCEYEKELPQARLYGPLPAPARFAPTQNSYHLYVTFRNRNAATFGVAICQGSGAETLVYYDTQTEEMVVDRTRSGLTAFHQRFPLVQRIPMDLSETDELELRLLVDRSTLEIFAQGGEYVSSFLIFPEETQTGITFFANKGLTMLEAARLFEIQQTVQPQRYIKAVEKQEQ